jgi:aminoglycoside 3-N-acetyltransferase
VREDIYFLARRLFSQERRDWLKDGLARGRKRLAPLIRVMNGSFDSVALQEELARALPRDFDALMVHCSFDDLLPMYAGSVGQLLGILREICGPQRTLVMPAFTYLVQGGDLIAHFSANPRFDARRQPSQMGLLSEVFRRTTGVLRSLHPTHSVCALGPHAASITAGHHLGEGSFGARSPFAQMAEIETVILGLGKPYYRVLTQTHVPEDLLGDRFPVPRMFRDVETILVDETGEHPYRLRVDVTRAERRLDHLRLMLPAGGLCEWRFHGTHLFWTRAGLVTDSLCEAALRGETLYVGARAR